MTLYESGESNGKISLLDILNGKRDIDGIKTDLVYEKIAYVLCRGGWPNSLKLNENQALAIPKNYIDVLCNSDISRVDGVRRDPSLARAILKSYARQVSTINSNQSLYNDVKANYADVSEKTILDYLNTLKNQFNVLHYREYQISARYQDDYGTTLISLPNGTVFELPRQKNLELYQYYLR